MKPLAAFVVPAPPAPVPAPPAPVPAPVAAASPEPEVDELPEPELPEPELPEPEDPELLELEPALLALGTMSPTSLLIEATVPANGAVSFVPLTAS
jgi:hypothetical protein